ncbi:MAG: RDD family protein [Thiotrichales bacterium]
MPLNNRSAVETPEGITFELATAGPFARFYAWLIDLWLRLLLYALIFVPLSYLGELGLGLILLVLFIGEWFYPVLFETLWSGATPGKHLLGLIVVHDDGTPIGWNASMLRNLVRVIDLLPGTYLLGLCSLLLTRTHQRLGDLVAGTLVIYRPRSVATPTPLDDDLPAVAPATALTACERETVLAFAERRPALTAERAEELARFAAPLLNPHQPAAPQLLALAHWLNGRRG